MTAIVAATLLLSLVAESSAAVTQTIVIRKGQKVWTTCASVMGSDPKSATTGNCVNSVTDLNLKLNENFNVNWILAGTPVVFPMGTTPVAETIPNSHHEMAERAPMAGMPPVNVARGAADQNQPAPSPVVQLGLHQVDALKAAETTITQLRKQLAEKAPMEGSDAVVADLQKNLEAAVTREEVAEIQLEARTAERDRLAKANEGMARQLATVQKAKPDVANNSLKEALEREQKERAIAEGTLAAQVTSLLEEKDILTRKLEVAEKSVADSNKLSGELATAKSVVEAKEAEIMELHQPWLTIDFSKANWIAVAGNIILLLALFIRRKRSYYKAGNETTNLLRMKFEALQVELREERERSWNNAALSREVDEQWETTLEKVPDEGRLPFRISPLLFDGKHAGKFVYFKSTIPMRCGRLVQSKRKFFEHVKECSTCLAQIDQELTLSNGHPDAPAASLGGVSKAMHQSGNGADSASHVEVPNLVATDSLAQNGNAHAQNGNGDNRRRVSLGAIDDTGGDPVLRKSQGEKVA